MFLFVASLLIESHLPPQAVNHEHDEVDHRLRLPSGSLGGLSAVAAMIFRQILQFTWDDSPELVPSSERELDLPQSVPVIVVGTRNIFALLDVN